MPTGLKLALAFNLLTLAIVLGVAASVGGGFSSGVFPPDEAAPLRLVRIEPDQVPPMPSRALPRAFTSERAAIPSEYNVPDPSPRPWVVLPDGSVHFDKLRDTWGAAVPLSADYQR